MAYHPPIVLKPTPTLPQGITAAEWRLERLRLQNPLIRAFLKCLRQMEEVVETDYHLMHCSPTRLVQIWKRARELSEMIRSSLTPALEGASAIPELETARIAARQALEVLEGDLLTRLDAFPEEPNGQRLIELRQLLCVAMGAWQTFLHAAFGEVMAADPRSSHDTDYYLSRRFPKEIRESEWLRENVINLLDYLRSLEMDRTRLLGSAQARLAKHGELPEPKAWQAASAFLVGLYNDMPSRLKEILCLQGIRFEEMTFLNRQCVEIPAKCLSLFELHEICTELLTRLGKEDVPQATVEIACRRALTRRLARLLGEIDSSIGELTDFVNNWLRDIELRRALVFTGGEPS